MYKVAKFELDEVNGLALNCLEVGDDSLNQAFFEKLGILPSDFLSLNDEEKNNHVYLLGKAKKYGGVEFVSWFSGSEVVDKKGMPKLVFHGTPTPGIECLKGGSFFTDKRVVAEQYAYPRGPWRSMFTDGEVLSAYLSLKSPLVIDAMGRRNNNIPVPWDKWKPKVFGSIPKNAWNMERIVNYAKENGFDSLIVMNVVDTADITDKAKSTVYVAFSQDQIKIVSRDCNNLEKKPSAKKQDVAVEVSVGL